jgi:hypothetical protein
MTPAGIIRCHEVHNQSFDAAHDTLVGIELMHMLKKRQLVVAAGEESLTATELFYSLAA